MFSFLSEFATAQKLVSQRFHVIFFSENKAYHQYFRHLYEALLLVPGIRIAYITSDKSDAILQDGRVQGFYSKATLAGVFSRLQADVVIMTMPDLQNFIFKKSPQVKKYVYVFHALVSTHQQYRRQAFDHYDAVFCTGPQQANEIRESEKRYVLPAKELVSYGYPLLQDLKAKAGRQPPQAQKLLLAPSWYPQGIFATCLLPLLESLRNSRYEVWIRPHPEFVKRNKKTYLELTRQAKAAKNLHFDQQPEVYSHLATATHLLTDRSGIAFEYAFATRRPVLFVDTPPKIQNPDVVNFSLEPLENTYRSALGHAIKPNETNRVLGVLDKLEMEVESFQASILQAESETVFPPGNHQNGVAYIRQQLS